MENHLDVKLDTTSSSSSSSPPISQTPKTPLSTMRMLLLNSAVLGVEIVSCASFPYIPPLLLKAGYSEESMGFLLASGSLVSFFLLPVILRASDRCHSQFGRRRPFILVLSVLLNVSLCLIPFSEYFATLLFGPSPLSKILSILGLSVGLVLMDVTTYACPSQCEALLNDVTKDTDQTDKIFTIYSMMIGIGGISGYFLAAIDWTSNPLGKFFGSQEACVYSILIFVVTLTLLSTLLVAQEVPLSKSIVPLETPNGDINSSSSTSSATKAPGSQIAHDGDFDPSSDSEEDVSLLVRDFSNEGRCLTKACSRVLRLGRQMIPHSFVQVFRTPTVLRLLAVADFCCWAAIMTFNTYYTDYVGRLVYGGNPDAPVHSRESDLYDEGVRVANWGLLLHCICSSVCSFFIIERLTNTCGYKMTVTIGMVSFVLAMMGMVLMRHIYVVNLMAALTGFAYATITAIPFMLVSKYQADKKTYFADLCPCDMDRGVGADIAILDLSYTLSEVILNVVAGLVVYITGTLVSYMITAAVMGLLSIYFIHRIVENEQQAKKCLIQWEQGRRVRSHSRP